jgi:type VI secretion system secreted protein Hcp
MKDIYIQFRGKYKVDGESRDSEHKDWLEINSWGHQIRQPKSATASSVGGHTAERAEHDDMVFFKDLDATSPKLWEACSAGYTFDEVQIDFYRANGDKRVKYLQIKLKHVLISNVRPEVMAEGVPTEAFGLKYAAVEWTYTQQSIDGASKGAVTKKWSLSNNTATYTD